MRFQSHRRLLGLVITLAVATVLTCPMECLEDLQPGGHHEVASGSSHHHESHGDAVDSHDHGAPPGEGARHEHDAGSDCCAALAARNVASGAALSEPVASLTPILTTRSTIETGPRAASFRAWWVGGGPAPPGRRYVVFLSLLI